jgi:hypothetical protein
MFFDSQIAPNRAERKWTPLENFKRVRECQTSKAVDRRWPVGIRGDVMKDQPIAVGGDRER